LPSYRQPSRLRCCWPCRLVAHWLGGMTGSPFPYSLRLGVWEHDRSRVAPVNREYYRETTLPDGTVQLHFTGSLWINYSTDAGASETVNNTGPGIVLFFQNGDVQVLGKGTSSLTLTPEQAATLGVPQIPVSAGPIDVTFHPDGSVSGHLGNIIEDVCAELTESGTVSCGGETVRL
jgi:hypothetical protein